MSELSAKLQMFERFQMSKRAITRLIVIAIALTAAGAVLGTVAVIAALANGAISIGGPQVVTVDAESVAWAIAGLVAGSLLAGVGTMVAIAAWVGALLNTARLADKTWFGALLVFGVVSLGWVAIIAYALAGPDGTTAPPAQVAGTATAQG